MKWIEITGAQLSPNPVSCGGALLVSVTVEEFERFLTVGEVNASPVRELNGTRLDLFKFGEEIT